MSEVAKSNEPCKFCGHCPDAHVRHTKGRFMGQKSECGYTKCFCVGYVPKSYRAPSVPASASPSDIPMKGMPL